MSPPANDLSEGFSIEETNKIRVRLGLKPLEVDPKDREIELNTADEKKRQLARERREALIRRINKEKEKTRLAESLSGPTLSQIDDDIPESPALWVSQHDKRVNEKLQQLLATRKAKEIEEQDRISSMSSSDYLKGMHVSHNVDDVDRSELILTLKDADVLKSEGDTLESIELVELEKSRLRSKNALEALGAGTLTDGTGILPKYDEPNEEKGFVLGRRGKFNLNGVVEERHKPPPGMIKESLDYQIKEISEAPIIIKSFKKKSMAKKMKNIVKRRRTEDVPIKSSVLDELSENINKDLDSIQPVPEKRVLDYSLSNKGKDLSAMNFIDDEDVRRALSSARKLALSKVKFQDITEVVDEISAHKSEPGLSESKAGLVLSTSTDFAKNLSSSLTKADDKKYKSRTSKLNSATNQVSGEQSTEIQNKSEPVDAKTGEHIENNEDDSKHSEIKTDDSQKSDSGDSDYEKFDSNALDDMPLISSGLGSTVSLLKQRGIIKPLTQDEIQADIALKKKDKWMAEKKLAYQELQAKLRKNKENVSYKQKKDANRRENREEKQASKEKIAFLTEHYKNYNPEVKLEYFDEMGRALSQKEAFRQLSHKFHGKTSGKIKTEARLRKVREELAAMSRQ